MPKPSQEIRKELLPQPHDPYTKDELNLAEYPFALLSDRPPKGITSLAFADCVVDKDGRETERKWVVNGSEAYGLPTSSDEPVYLALMQLGREQGFSAPLIKFIFADLLKRLGLSDDGRSYKRVRASLLRLTGVQITADRSFFDKAKGRYSTKSFHILDSFEINGGPGRKEESFVRFSEELFGSIQAGALNTLDFSVYLSLESSIARRLYRYLDKAGFDGKDVFRIGLHKLAFERLGMSRSYYPSQIKRSLEGAHKELVSIGFLKDVRYTKGREDELVVYRFSRGGEKHAEAVEALVARGMTAAAARRLVSDHGFEKVLAHVEAFERLSRSGGLKARNPGGWLRTAIEQDFVHSAPPEPLQPVLVAVSAPQEPEQVTEEDYASALEAFPDEVLESLRDRISAEVRSRPMFVGRMFSASMHRLIESQFRREVVLLARQKVSDV
jgi:plasmid replication initiation protein